MSGDLSPVWIGNPLSAETQLGRSGVKCSPMGCGCWAWGTKDATGAPATQVPSPIEGAFRQSLQSGVMLFDTAESYNKGASEALLGKLLATCDAEQRSKVVIASKYLPLPWHFNSRRALVGHLRGSLRRLGTPYVDLYQVHGPALSMRPVEVLVEGLADAYHLGLTRAVGVSNFSPSQLRRAHVTLAARGVPLASNQVEFSLLRQNVETGGMLAACRELGVSLLAYSPLAMGRLAGLYSASRPPAGRRRFGNVPMEQVEPLLQAMRTMGAAYGGKTPAQIALNWCMCKGAIPIPGAKNGRQAEDNAGAMGWRLTHSDMVLLDSLGQPGKTSWFWQHG